MREKKQWREERRQTLFWEKLPRRLGIFSEGVPVGPKANQRITTDVRLGWRRAIFGVSSPVL